MLILLVCRSEAANGVRFQELFQDILPQIYVPHMYTDLTTPRALVMEWVDGVRLRTAASAARDSGRAGTPPAAGEALGDANGGGVPYTKEQAQDALRLVEVGVQCSLEQMLEVRPGKAVALVLSTAVHGPCRRWRCYYV